MGVFDLVINFFDLLCIVKIGVVEEIVEDFYGCYKIMIEWKYCCFIMVIGSLIVFFLVGRVLELFLKKIIIGKFGKVVY